jgi:hypothetical protein
MEEAGKDPPDPEGEMSRLSADEIQEIIDDIIETIPLRDLVSLANLDEAAVKILQQALGLYLRRHHADEKEIPEIMEALWQRVKETHRLRVVGDGK